MRRKRVTIAVALLLAGLLAAIGIALSGWTGFGFSPGGLEMLRLRQALALRPGMSVADIGTGRGQLTLALAREVGPAGSRLCNRHRR